MNNEPIFYQSTQEVLAPIGKPWMRGDGLFETIKVENGVPLLLSRHLTRLRASTAAFLFPECDWQSIKDRAYELASQWSETTGRMRLTVFSSAEFLITIDALPDMSKNPVKLGIAKEPIHSQGILAGRKSISYATTSVLLRRAVEAGLTDYVLLNERGEVVETSVANIFAAIEGEILTPPLASGCLPGVVRELLLEMDSRIVERTLTAADLAKATTIFVTSSLRGISQVSLLVTANGVRNFVANPDIENLRQSLVARWAEESSSITD